MFGRHFLIWAFLVCGAGLQAAEFRPERRQLSSGAQLITYFERTDDGREMPIFAVLRDELNPKNHKDDRLRQVWVFTYSRPTIWQRVIGGVPFLYRRTGSEIAKGTPYAAVDLGAPAQGVASGVGMALVQAHVLDPFGLWTRLTTRSYGGNLSEYRRMHVREAVDVIAATPNRNEDEGLSSQELQDIESRLYLNGKLLGGMVRDEYLDRAYNREYTRRMENRGHNWELLRQSAEQNGLYFKPLPFESMPDSFAMVWVRAEDLRAEETKGSNSRRFNSQFLDIRDPFSDADLRRWTGPSEIWNENGRETRMIPLALYSLDYPGVPYRLIDFRRPTAPKRFEMARKAADDLTVGVLGFTTFGNLGYAAAKSSYLFVSKRHGGATDRAARKRVTVQLRHALGMDAVLSPELRRELAQATDRLAIDPVDSTWDAEFRSAWNQYRALQAAAYVEGPVDRIVFADRQAELRRSNHEGWARVGLKLATVSSFGIYRHRELEGPHSNAQLEQERELAWTKRRGTSAPVETGGGQ